MWSMCLLYVFLFAGECGKSTILKQMQILHSGGFDVETRHGYRDIIYSNILDTVVLITQHVHDHSGPHIKHAIDQLSGVRINSCVLLPLGGPNTCGSHCWCYVVIVKSE